MRVTPEPLAYTTPVSYFLYYGDTGIKNRKKQKSRLIK